MAIEVIASDGAPSADRIQRFEQEARAVGVLGHPSILAVYDVGTHESQAYVVFELLEGETLRDRLQRGPLPVRKAVELRGQIGQGLAAAHARGVVHRDLKPANLFLTRDGRVKILDFGLAKLVEPTAPEASQEATPTVTGAFLGTPGYAAPEQVRAAPVDHRVDLFALGAVLYEMATWQEASKGATAADTLSAVLNRDPPSIDGASAGGGEAVPAALERVVRRCLEKDPEERFQSARDVAFALEALAGTSATTAGPAPAGARPKAWRGLTAIGLAGLAAIGGYLGGTSRPDPHGTRSAVRFVAFPPAQAPNIDCLRVSPDGTLRRLARREVPALGHVGRERAGRPVRPAPRRRPAAETATRKPVHGGLGPLLARRAVPRLCLHREHRRNGVFVQPSPPTGVRWQVSAAGGGYSAWRSDGRELFDLGGGKLMVVDVRPGSDRHSFGKPRVLFEAPPLRHPARSPYVVTPDGQRFLFVKELESRWKQPIVVVSDWLAGRGR